LYSSTLLLSRSFEKFNVTHFPSNFRWGNIGCFLGCLPTGLVPRHIMSIDRHHSCAHAREDIRNIPILSSNQRSPIHTSGVIALCTKGRKSCTFRRRTSPSQKLGCSRRLELSTHPARFSRQLPSGKSASNKRLTDFIPTPQKTGSV
jgi:hypothetical protein